MPEPTDPMTELAAGAPSQGADIEIIDRNGGDGTCLIPSAVRINGTEISIPGDAKIRIHDLSASEIVTVTITMFARRVTITAADDL